MNELEQLVELQKTEETNYILENMASLKNITKENKKLPLIDFEKYLLPYYLGEVDKTDANTAVFTANYLEITDSYHIGIDVIDTDGSVKYSLPPLIGDTGIDKLDNIAFATLVDKINLYLETSPLKANQILEKVSEAVNDNLDTTEVNDEYTKTIYKILIDYIDRVNKRLKDKNIELPDTIVKTNNKEKEEEEEEDLFDY